MSLACIPVRPENRQKRHWFGGKHALIYTSFVLIFCCCIYSVYNCFFYLFYLFVVVVFIRLTVFVYFLFLLWLPKVYEGVVDVKGCLPSEQSCQPEKS